MPLRSSDDEEMVFVDLPDEPLPKDDEEIVVVDDPDEPVPDDITMDKNPGCDQEGAASPGGSSSTVLLSPR